MNLPSLAHRLIFILRFGLLHFIYGPRMYRNFLQVHIDIFLRHKKSLLHTSSGLIYKIRPGYFDIATLDQIYIEHVYGPPGFDIHTGDTVVDIGAYIGDFSVLAASQTGPSGKVYAFEPVAETYSLLAENKHLNHQSHLFAFSYGLGDKDTSVTFRTGSHLPQPGASAYDLHKMGYDTSEYKTETVQIRNINTVLTQLEISHIDVLKIDCEGAEYDIFDSLSKPILQTLRICMVEYHDIFSDDHRKPAVLIKILQEAGMHITSSDYDMAANTGMIYAIRK